MAAKKRDEQLHLLVTSEEKELYQKAADTSGLQLSAWIRLALTKVANLGRKTIL